MSVSIVDILKDQLQASQIQGYAGNQQDFEVQSMTYNVRTDKASSGPNPPDKGDKNWENRKDEVMKVLTGQVPRDNQHSGNIGPSDFVGVQEVETQNQWEFILQGMEGAGYSLASPGNWDTSNGNMLFYKNNTWSLKSEGMFDITPDEYGARKVVYGHFVRKGTGQDMWAFSAHFARHNGEASLQDIANHIGQITGDPTSSDKKLPVLFMGDLNDKKFVDGDPSYDHDPAFSWRGLFDPYQHIYGTGTPGSTDHAWGPDPSSHREDEMFAGGVDWDQKNTSDILHYSYTGKDGKQITPSDHYAVVSDLWFSGDNAPTPHTPLNIQDLENELTQWGIQDPSVKDFAANLLKGVQNLNQKGTSLPYVEAWVYTVAKGISANDVMPAQYQKLTKKEQGDFNILSGLSDFQNKLSTHSLDHTVVTEIAGNFAKGVSGLKNPQDRAFMSAFYDNLSAGQDPNTAAQNAYKKVGPGEVSASMNTLIQGLSGYIPPAGNENTVGSILGRVQEGLHGISPGGPEENPFGNSGFEGELF
jgi:hypothetical protein